MTQHGRSPSGWLELVTDTFSLCGKVEKICENFQCRRKEEKESSRS